MVAVTFRMEDDFLSLYAVRGIAVQPGQMQFTRPPQYFAVWGAILAISFFNVLVIPKAIAALADA